MEKIERPKYSLILVTDNSESYLQDLMWTLLEQIDLDTTQLIIVDNMSEDQTVPILVGTIGYDFMNEQRVKFYINTSKKKEKDSIALGLKLAKGKPFIIKTKGRLRKDYLRKRGIV